MTDLTEQWKKGELPEGWYWVKRVTWSECINMLYNWSDTFLDGDVPVDNDEITEVLAPVPSYEEYLSLTYAKEEDEKIIAEYEEENAQLKELLKECRLAIFDYPPYDLASDKIRLTIKIDEVLK